MTEGSGRYIGLIRYNPVQAVCCARNPRSQPSSFVHT